MDITTWRSCDYIYFGTLTVTAFDALSWASSIASITAVASSHLTASSAPYLMAAPRLRNSSAYAPASEEGHLQGSLVSLNSTQSSTHVDFVTVSSSASNFSIVPHRYSGSRPYWSSRMALGDDMTLSWSSWISTPNFKYVPCVPRTTYRNCGERTESI